MVDVAMAHVEMVDVEMAERRAGSRAAHAAQVRPVRSSPVTVLASGYGALEGPNGRLRRGMLYVSDLTAGGIHRMDRRARSSWPSARASVAACPRARGGLVVSSADLAHLHGAASRVLLSLDDLQVRPGTSAVGFNDIHADRGGCRVFAGVLGA